MTNEEMLEIMKLRADDDSASDSLLLSYLKEAQQIIFHKVYPFVEELGDIPEKYHYKQLEIAVYLFSKLGAEGETMHTEAQITRMYEKGSVPDSMLKGITPMCGTYEISEKE